MISFSDKNRENTPFSKSQVFTLEKRFDRTPCTFEAWIKLNYNHFGNYCVISSYANKMYPCISFQITKGHPLLLWGDPSYVCSYTFNKVDLITNDWVHVALVRDFDMQQIRCYVGGVLAETQVMHPASRELDCGVFSIGGDMRENNSHSFCGRLGLLALYSSARTNEQICADMTSPEHCPELMALYDTFRTERLSDLSGNGYDAVKLPASKSNFIPNELVPPLEDYDYSFAVLGDIQTLLEDYPEYFHMVYDWLLENKDKHKIKYVLGLGDTISWPCEKTWELAMENVLRLNGNIPFTFARGNHDTVEQYNKFFPYSKFKDTMDGSYDDTMLNTYKLFTLGKRKFLLFVLDFGPAMEILNWASEIVEAHQDCNVIITTHSYIFRDGHFHDSTYPYPPHLFGGVLNGDEMWEHFIRKHKNIILVLCGHISSETIVLRHDFGDNGNLITTLLIDPQDIDDWFGGLGMVAMLYFRQRDNTVQVRHYSTVKEKYFSSSAQFSFKLDFVNEDNTF